MAILWRAGSALHSGRPGAALVALAEHQRRFPGRRPDAGAHRGTHPSFVRARPDGGGDDGVAAVRTLVARFALWTGPRQGVGCWGGCNTIAQAIWNVQHSRSAGELAQFLSKLRVYDVLGQDDAGAWMTKNFPDLLFIRATQVYSWQPSASWVVPGRSELLQRRGQHPERLVRDSDGRGAVQRRWQEHPRHLRAEGQRLSRSRRLSPHHHQREVIQHRRAPESHIRASVAWTSGQQRGNQAEEASLP